MEKEDSRDPRFHTSNRYHLRLSFGFGSNARASGKRMALDTEEFQVTYPDCITKFRAIHDSGPRAASLIKYVVLHDTEGSTAEGGAMWFTNPLSKGSANLVIDDDVCYKTVPDLVIPWAAPPLNTKGFHIEIAGFEHWNRAQWMAHTTRLDNAAYRTALRCKEHQIPIQFIDAEMLLKGMTGITTHAEISAAWKQTDHTDPGPEFPMDWFLKAVVAHTHKGTLV